MLARELGWLTCSCSQGALDPGVRGLVLFVCLFICFYFTYLPAAFSAASDLGALKGCEQVIFVPILQFGILLIYTALAKGIL